ncbi:hypothetical protein JW916_06430 [Candidatus Sumerlaeota bacterium]|nr:hypothetical protein [Candidatus Sumerlaeota bacterium]
MIRNPILKVLSTLRSSKVRFLLMGGQACVFYGAAEFSRDTDIVILADRENLERLSEALSALQAECIAVPELSADALHRGHAVHFRCRHPDVAGMRLDVMSVLRGVDSFEALWERRTTIETEEGDIVDLLSLPDLVAAKKTQRDKDWLMLRRLVEAHMTEHRENPEASHFDFWLQECRTPGLLIEIADGYPDRARELSARRPLLTSALAGDESAVEKELEAEEKQERENDRAYWKPLMAELEQLRRARSK